MRVYHTFALSIFFILLSTQRPRHLITYIDLIMASGFKSGAAGIQNDLMTITEGVTSRDQSPSPKFYDCISLEIHSLNTDISDFESSSQVLEKTPGPQNFSGGSSSKKAFSGNKSLSHLPRIVFSATTLKD